MKTLKYSLISFALSLLVVSCTEETRIEPVNPVEPQSVRATINLNVPTGGFDVVTRALTTGDEHKVTRIDVLEFYKDPSNAVWFRSVRSAELIDGTSATKSVSIDIQISADPVQFVVLANAPATLVSGAGLVNTMTKTQVMNLLEIENTAAWSATSLPMWGETEFKVYNTAAAAGQPIAIDMLRAMARIDVAVATAAQSSFTLNEVYLYNPSTKGRVAPAETNWNAAGGTVTAPSAPNSGWTASATAFPYTVSDGKQLPVRTVYTFEAPAAATTSATGATCLVVKGSWNGQPDSYYRIDFHNDTDGLLPLLRNYLYDVRITNVSGNGYSSAADALKAGFSGLTAVTHQWNEGLMGSTVWDGQYYLTVSQNEYAFYPDPHTLTIQLATNYTDANWKAVVATTAAETDWLTITGSDTGTGSSTPTPQTLTLNIKLNSDADRTGTITITAGRLKQTITVFQQLEPLLEISLGDVEMIFPATAPTAQALRVEWEPAATPCDWALSAVSGYSKQLTFTGANALPANITDEDSNALNGGARNFTFRPDEDLTLAKFEEKRSTMRVTATAADLSTEYRDILLRQFDYAIEVSDLRSEYHLGTTYSLTLKANAIWEISSMTGDTSEITVNSATTGEPDITGNTKFEFKTGQNPNTQVVVTFRLKEHPTVTQAVTINIQELDPNCYIVTPGSYVNIPIRKAFSIWSTDPDLGGVSLSTTPADWGAELLWQDAVGVVSAAPTIIGTTPNGAYIRVNTSGVEGNAVVAFTIGSGADKIKWSWHLWVTNFDPDDQPGYNVTGNHTIMRRNLGAIRTDPLNDSDVGTYGLHYQYDRKDPFPGARTKSAVAYNSAPIYNLSGTELTEGQNVANEMNGTGITRKQVDVYNNTANAILFPMMIYYNTLTTGSASLQSWYTNDVTGNYYRNFWKDNNSSGFYKTTYDPCPAGWKVPDSTILENAMLSPTSSNGANLYDLNYNYVGFFPFSGERTNAGYIRYTSRASIHWFSTQGGTARATQAAAWEDHIVLSGGVGKVQLKSVRCVKIQ